MATGGEGGAGAVVAGAEAAEDGEVVVEDFEKKKLPSYLSTKHLYLPDHYSLSCFFFVFLLLISCLVRFPFFLIFLFLRESTVLIYVRYRNNNIVRTLSQ
jgi:hypothetical protein